MTDRTQFQLSQGEPVTPYSEEAEEATLGAVITNPNYFYVLSTFLKAADFFILRHQYIWEAIERIIKRDGGGVDYITVKDELIAIGRLDEVGGPFYLLRLVNNTPTSVHAEVYGRIVERYAQRRRFMTASSELMALSLRDDLSIEDLGDQAITKVLSVMDNSLKTNKRTVREGMLGYAERKEALVNTDGLLIGLDTGYPNFNKLTSGLQPGIMYIVAGRPGMGKSSFALSTALNVAVGKNQQKPGDVVIQSGEMGFDQVMDRLIAIYSGLNLQRVINPKLMDASELRRAEEAQKAIYNLKITIDDTAGITPGHLLAMCYLEKMTAGLDFVVEDYMGLMSVPGMAGNKVAEMSAISLSMKNLARKCNVPVFALAQLSRTVEQRTDKRPLLSDLRDSGALEADADLVIFVYRDEVYNDATEYPNQADLIVAKHRQGPTGVCTLYFDSPSTAFIPAKTHHIDLGRDYVPAPPEDDEY